jgi:hypothetical protein
LEAFEEHTMPGRFFVEREGAACMANFEDAFGKLDPPQWAGLVSPKVLRLPVRGAERIAGKYVLDIREDQLLVLLFLMQSELDDLGLAL